MAASYNPSPDPDIIRPADGVRLSRVCGLKRAKIILLVMGLLLLSLMFLTPVDPGPTEQAVLAALESHPQNFWALSRTQSMEVNEVEESNWLLGSREGIAAIELTVHTGFDLQALTPADVAIDDRHVSITLPEVKVLAVEPDLASYRAVTKTSLINIMGDVLRGRSVREELFDAAHSSLNDLDASSIGPSRDEMIDRLNQQTPKWSSPLGWEVTFE